MKVTAVKVDTPRDHVLFKSDDDKIQEYNQVLNWPNKPLTDEELDICIDRFSNYLETVFSFGDLDHEIADNAIQLQNFFPAFYGKEIGDGKWIRIKTETGYNVYWAKHSNKVLSTEYFERKIRRMRNNPIKKLETEGVKEGQKAMDQLKELQNWHEVATAVSMMPSPLKFVKYLRTRTQWAFALPHEYEVVTDIQLYIDAVQCRMNKNAVKYKQLFTKQDHDQVFYLQSRGIPKDMAIMMCKLQQCYFVVDTQELFNEAIQVRQTN